MAWNVKNLLEFGFFCDINQPLPWHPILACQMLSGLNLKTAILISTLTLAKFLWYDERFCKEKSVRWKTQNPIWKVFDIAGLVLSETAVKTSLVLEIRCRKNLMKLYFIYHEFKDTCNNNNNNNNIYLYRANLTIQFSNAPYD